MDMANLSAFMFYDDRLYLQVAGVTGADNTNWSDGNNFYANVSYDWFRKTRNDLWLIGEYYGGTDFPSIMTRTKDSFLCPGICPPGVTDQNFSISNSPGEVIVNAPVEQVEDFDSFRLSLEHSAADRGAHTWYAATTFLTMTQNFESGAKVEDTQVGAYLRYFYERTYGVEVYVRDHLKYEYTTPAGLKRDTYTKPNYGITLLWYPAMNFDFWLRYYATRAEHRLRGRARAVQRQGVELRARHGIQLLTEPALAPGRCEIRESAHLRKEVTMWYVQRRQDAPRPVFRLLCGAILAAAVAGCAGTPEKRGFPWWPQGPGGASGEVLRAAEAEPSNADHTSESSEDKGAGESSQPATHTETVRSSSRQPANSHTQAVRYGDLLFVSGQFADDPASLEIVGSNIQAQVRAAMDNVVRILESHGLATSNILSVTMYMRDIDELPKADAIYVPYFRRGLPARSVVRVDGLPKGSLVEISVIAGK